MTEAADVRLRAGGYRITAQRQLVLAAVTELRHATPEQILTVVHRTSPGVNLSTIYRVLVVLEDVGLVRHAHIGQGSPTYHATDAPAHIHPRCDDCGKVQSVPVQSAASFVTRIHDATGFSADVTHTAIAGRCSDCAGSS